MHQIALALVAAYGHEPEQQAQSPTVRARRATLEAGRAGGAVFFGYLAASTGSAEHRATAERLLGEALDVTAPRCLGGLLDAGSVGIAWALAHLERRFGILPHGGADAREFTRQVDEQLLARVSEAPWRDSYDLVGGIVGLGVYALERLPDERAGTTLEQIVGRLDQRAERGPEGIAWWTDPDHVGRPPEIPNGCYVLGLAHGVPGVVALLAQLYAAGIAAEQSRSLVEGALRWLFAHRLPLGSGSHFSKWIQPEEEHGPTRQTWCYGDLGIACALLATARCIGDPAIEQEALAIALDVAERPYRLDTVNDPTLCHGAIGNSHLFRRLFGETGDERFRQAAERELARGLAMRRAGGLMGGFAALVHDTAKGRRRIAYRGLLDGAAGIGLALLAAGSPVEPSWDRILLLS